MSKTTKRPSGVDIYYRQPKTMLLRIKHTGAWEYKQTRGGRWVYVWVPNAEG